MKEEHLVEVNTSLLHACPLLPAPLLIRSQVPFGEVTSTRFCHLHHVCLMVWRRAVGGKPEFILDSRKILLTEKKLSWLPKHKWSVKNLRPWPGKPYNECLPSSEHRPCYCHEKYPLWLKMAHGGAHLKGITASWPYGPIWIMPAHHTSFCQSKERNQQPWVQLTLVCKFSLCSYSTSFNLLQFQK